MNKKKWTLLFMGLFIIIIGMAVPKLMAENRLTIGPAQSDFIALPNGSYIVENIDLEPNTYAIYAVTGTGTVDIDGLSHALDSTLFEDFKQEAGPIAYNLLYAASPKITLTKNSVIRVEGDASFKISFVKKFL